MCLLVSVGVVCELDLVVSRGESALKSADEDEANFMDVRSEPILELTKWCMRPVQIYHKPPENDAQVQETPTEEAQKD